MGHSPELSPENAVGLVDRLRILHGQVLDLGVRDTPVRSGPHSVAADCGPTSWIGNCPTSRATPPASSQGGEEKDKSRVSTSKEGSAQKEEESEEEEPVTKESSEDKETSSEAKEESAEKKIVKPSSRAPRVVEKPSVRAHQRKESQGRKQKKKSRSRSRTPKPSRRREKDSRREEEEKSEHSTEPIRLRPKSPDYPPPGHQGWDQDTIIPSGKTNPHLRKSPWRSKGKKRQLRWDDIQTFGYSAERKALLERKWKYY